MLREHFDVARASLPGVSAFVPTFFRTSANPQETSARMPTLQARMPAPQLLRMRFALKLSSGAFDV